MSVAVAVAVAQCQAHSFSSSSSSFPSSSASTSSRCCCLSTFILFTSFFIQVGRLNFCHAPPSSPQLLCLNILLMCVSVLLLFVVVVPFTLCKFSKFDSLFFFILCALVSFFLLPFFVSCFSAEFSAPFLVIQLGFFFIFFCSCASPFLLLLMCGKGIPSQGRVGQVELAKIATLTRLVSSRSYRSKYMKQVHSIRFINKTVAPSDDESF